MKRRHFLQTGILSTFSLGMMACKGSDTNNADSAIDVVSHIENTTTVYSNMDFEALKVFHITDTHLSLDDDRGKEYQQYSERMSKAYLRNVYLKTGEIVSAQTAFLKTLALAKKEKADLLALTGDIFSFPSIKNVEWTIAQLEKTEIPYIFTAGNHDWHYEGMRGSSKHLRAEWIEKNLQKMYQQKNPLCSYTDYNGVRFITIDNSIYEILAPQLQFFKEQQNCGLPLVLLMHVPLYMPGENMDYACGNPNWGAETDENYQIEKRERWSANGPSQITMEFYKDVFQTNNLLAILTGHTHRTALYIKNKIPQITSANNSTGAFGILELKPLLMK